MGRKVGEALLGSTPRSQVGRRFGCLTGLKGFGA